MSYQSDAKITMRRPKKNDTVEDMYHLLQSLETINNGFRHLEHGLREVQAGVTNLRVYLSEIEDIAVREYDDMIEEELKKVAIPDPSSNVHLRRVPKAAASLRGGSGNAGCGCGSGKGISSRPAENPAGAKNKNVNPSGSMKKAGSGGNTMGPFELGGKPVYTKPDVNVARPKS